MITIENLTKTFDDYKALDDFSTVIAPGSIYGLVGSNGSGKSTLLRLISGIFTPDSGSVLIEGQVPFNNPYINQQIVFVADDPFFFQGSDLNEMARYYEETYPTFDRATYDHLCQRMPIPSNKKINTFSKGMKRQAAIILALSTKPKFLLLDEVFDGLDPVVRTVVRRLLSEAITDNDLTVMIASHNLRELEDLCDHMGLLHRGKVVFQREIDEAKLGLCKVQLAFKDHPGDEIFDSLEILSKSQQGTVINLIARGNANDVKSYLEGYSPLFVDSISLTLEEVFIYEMEAIGYDYTNIL